MPHRYYKHLHKSDAVGLPAGSHVFLRFLSGVQGRDDVYAPAMLLKPSGPDRFTIAYQTEESAATVDMDYESYGLHYDLATVMPHVSTPDGDIVVELLPNDEYPAVHLSLRQPWAGPRAQPILLSMTEYVSGGEIVSKKDMPDASAASFRTEHFHHGFNRMKAGVVTRSFPDDAHRNWHSVMPHYGYAMRETVLLSDDMMKKLTDAMVVGAPALSVEHDLPIELDARFADGMTATLRVTLESGYIIRRIVLTDDSGTEQGVTELPEFWSPGPVRLSCDGSGVDYVLDFQSKANPSADHEKDETK